MPQHGYAQGCFVDIPLMRAAANNGGTTAMGETVGVDIPPGVDDTNAHAAEVQQSMSPALSCNAQRGLSLYRRGREATC